MATIRGRYGKFTRQFNTINVSPTLFLALGGSGKETVMRLRRSLYTNMRLTGLPIHEFLWIDTDPSRQDIRGDDYDEISSSLYLPETDIIDAQVPPHDIKNYFNRPANYDHIFKWMHPSIKNLGPNMLQCGAGMVRPCGRLSFFHHFDKIRQAIETKLKAVNGGNRINQTQKLGFTVNAATTNVIIICSNAGGTGAGMLIDTAFLLNWVAEKIGQNITPTGIIFLPSVFGTVLKSQQQDVAYSNGYATLMELDYYMSPKTGINIGDEMYEDLTFNWDGNDYRVNASPLHTVYLLGAKNNSDVAMGKENYTNAFQMAADSIFLEYCNSQFGDEKRSVRVNFQDFLMDETQYLELDDDGNEIYSQYYPNRYSSFGLSFIKLDIDRKRNAAAYFLGNALAEYWSSSARDEKLAVRDTDAALRMDIFEGKSLGCESMGDFLMAREVESILDVHKKRIKEDYSHILQRVRRFFKHNLDLGLEKCDQNLSPLVAALKEEKNQKADKDRKLENRRDVYQWTTIEVPDDWNAKPGMNSQGVILDDEGIIITLVRAARGWAALTDVGSEQLSSGGQDADQINSNATVLLEEIKKTFEEHFFKHLSRPGVADGARGIDQTKLFCQKYRQRIEQIIGEAVVKPLKKCDFVLDPIKKSRTLLDTLKYKRQAQKIRAPLYGKTAAAFYNKQYGAELRKHLNGVADHLEAKVNKVEMDLLEWFETKYRNHAKKKVVHILNQVLKMIDRFINDLDSFKKGVTELAAQQNLLFAAYNRDNPDLRYHLVYQNNDDQWFKDEIQKVLADKYADGQAMLWAEFMPKETEAVLKQLQAGAGATYIKGFKQLFAILLNRKKDKNQWEALVKVIERHCFESMSHFMNDNNAETEFQSSNVNHHQELAKVCKAADIWTKASALAINPVSVTSIGAPVVGTPTAQHVVQRVDGFGGAQELLHERGNLVFYREQVGFPLCYLWELDMYHRTYADMTADLKSLYKRHLDYHLINVLRPVKPPATQADARKIFDTGLDVMEALILGCLRWETGEKGKPGKFWIKSHQSEGNQVIKLGGNLNNVIEILKSTPKWVATIQKRIKERKGDLSNRDGDGNLKIYKMLEHFQSAVYPQLSRAGWQGAAEYNSNSGLLCEYLRKRYLKTIISQNGYEDAEDPKLWEKINAIDLEAISSEISFRDTETQAPVRILKCGS